MNSSLLAEVFGVTPVEARGFFLRELTSIPTRSTLNDLELDYVARVLAHYTCTPWERGRPITIQVNEETVPFAFTRTELSPYLYAKFSSSKETQDAGDCENKGSHLFLMIGFFRRQMENENNVNLYQKIAQGYYDRARLYTTNENRRIFYRRFTSSLPLWADICSKLSKSLEERRFNPLLISIE